MAVLRAMWGQVSAVPQHFRHMSSLAQQITVGPGNLVAARVQEWFSTARVYKTRVCVNHERVLDDVPLLYQWKSVTIGQPSDVVLATYFQNVCGHRILTMSSAEQVEWLQKTFGVHPVAQEANYYLMAHPTVSFPKIAIKPLQEILYGRNK